MLFEFWGRKGPFTRQKQLWLEAAVNEKGQKVMEEHSLLDLYMGRHSPKAAGKQVGHGEQLPEKLNIHFVRDPQHYEELCEESGEEVYDIYLYALQEESSEGYANFCHELLAQLLYHRMTRHFYEYSLSPQSLNALPVKRRTQQDRQVYRNQVYAVLEILYGRDAFFKALNDCVREHFAETFPKDKKALHNFNVTGTRAIRRMFREAEDPISCHAIMNTCCRILVAKAVAFREGRQLPDHYPPRDYERLSSAQSARKMRRHFDYSLASYQVTYRNTLVTLNRFDNKEAREMFQREYGDQSEALLKISVVRGETLLRELHKQMKCAFQDIVAESAPAQMEANRQIHRSILKTLASSDDIERQQAALKIGLYKFPAPQKSMVALLNRSEMLKRFKRNIDSGRPEDNIMEFPMADKLVESEALEASISKMLTSLNDDALSAAFEELNCQNQREVLGDQSIDHRKKNLEIFKRNLDEKLYEANLKAYPNYKCRLNQARLREERTQREQRLLSQPRVVATARLRLLNIPTARDDSIKAVYVSVREHMSGSDEEVHADDELSSLSGNGPT